LQTKIASCLYITGLNVLEGALPSEIGIAKELTVLDFREFMRALLVISMTCINFFFSLFAQKGGNNNLDDDKTNQLTGQIPSEIGAASNLELINFCKLHLK